MEQSPVPSFSLGQHGADSAIPGLDIDPPAVEIRDGRPVLSRHASQRSERGEIGVGGWISNMLKRGGISPGESDSKGGAYKQLEQDDD